MEQLDFFDVPSPCIGVCSLNERGYCKGCMRKREERFNWQTLTSAQKQHIIRLCRQRYRRYHAKNTTQSTNDKKSSENPQSSLF
ncbi:DUF1289 domain-containing protein [Vibrio gallicus]|uniref:DUF1289 domain-containing protein n=1 Tax=Vibrio gallicus TaxID=190897 RepID=UPI0021C37E1E|nr:DUF1289 domain-containing protein [Vibrio gallicus]